MFTLVNIMWIVNTWPFYVKINKDRTRLNGTEHTLNLTLSISLTHHYCSESLNAVKVSMGPKLFYSLITPFFNSYFLTLFIAWELLEILMIPFLSVCVSECDCHFFFTYSYFTCPFTMYGNYCKYYASYPPNIKL